ncbi:MAG TPA: glycosyltransferase [Paracoccaceae bacterium]|nr:glycosyltransferase [Paracoccaceae bacterium]
MTDVPLPSATAPRAPLLSIVVPAFNESEVVDLFLAPLAPRWKRPGAEVGPGGRSEIVFVDDASIDRTAERIVSRVRPGAGVRLVKLSRNFGKDAALAAGLAHAHDDAVMPMGADLQDPPEPLERMAAWRGGAKVVNAVRGDRLSDDRSKRTRARLLCGLFDRLSTYPVTPDVGDFRLLERSAVAVVNRRPERIRFMKGPFAGIGFKQITIGHVRPPRAGGASKWRPSSLWNFALDGITGSPTPPLRIRTHLGATIAFGTLAYAGFVVLRTLVSGVDVPGYASLPTAILTPGGPNLLAVGTIGEHVGRIAVKVRARPLHVVEAVIESAAPIAPEPDAPPDGASARVGRSPPRPRPALR